MAPARPSPSGNGPPHFGFGSPAGDPCDENWHSDRHPDPVGADVIHGRRRKFGGSLEGLSTVMTFLAAHSYNDALIAPNYTTSTARGMIRRMAELSRA
jgi:hypothetical protein